MSEISSEIKETDNNKDVTESELDKELAKELDASYDKYTKDTTEKSFKKRKETDFSDNSQKNEYNAKEEIQNNGVDNYREKESDNAENTPTKIKCRNENLEGQQHPETGVPFERKQVEVNGKQYEVVVPEFQSSFDAKLPENMYEAADHEQFKECNSQLKEEITTNKNLREKFDEEQLEQIEDGETPDGFTWHHDAKPGRMQLVDTETHQKTGHTGGRSIWGGGTNNR